MGSFPSPLPRDGARERAVFDWAHGSGRPKLIEQLRSLPIRLGGTLLSHDGGIEDSATLLPGLVSQANAVLFPAGCVSHQAAAQVKRLCLAAGKPFTPLRSASITSFLAAIVTLEEQAPARTAI